MKEFSEWKRRRKSFILYVEYFVLYFLSTFEIKFKWKYVKMKQIYRMKVHYSNALTKKKLNKYTKQDKEIWKNEFQIWKFHYLFQRKNVFHLRVFFIKFSLLEFDAGKMNSMQRRVIECIIAFIAQNFGSNKKFITYLNRYHFNGRKVFIVFV